MPGKMSEYAEIVTKEALPNYSRIGLKLVASWHGFTGNPNAIYALFVFNDLAEFEKVSKAARQDKGYMAAQAKIAPILIGQTRQLLEANAWSPMK